MIYKIRILAFLLTLAILSAYNYEVTSQEAETGDGKSRDKAGFQAQQMDLGAISQSVNQFSGDVALNIPLISLSGKNGLNVNVNLSYSSNIHKIINTENTYQQSPWVGLGWTLGVNGLPLNIVADPNSTQDVGDDRYYLAGGTELIYDDVINSNEVMYHPDYNKFTKCVRVYDATNKVIDKWIMTLEDGTILEYGGADNCRSKLLVWGYNWIGSSKQAPTGYANHTWHLRSITNIYNNTINFEYEIETGQIPGGYSFTQAVYLKKITDTRGKEVWFNLQNRDNNEYDDRYCHSSEPDAYMEQYETKYLDQIIVKNADGSTSYSYDLNYTTQTTHFVANGVATALTDKFRKRQLLEIKQYDKNGIAQPGTIMSYLPSSSTGNQGALSEVIYPSGYRVKYEYTTLYPTSTLNKTLSGVVPAGINGKIFISSNYAVIPYRDGNKISVYACYWTGYKWEGLSETSPIEPLYTIINSGTEAWSNTVHMGDEFFIVNTKVGDNEDNESLYIFWWDKRWRSWLMDSIKTNAKTLQVAVGKNYYAAITKYGGNFYRRFFTGRMFINCDTYVTPSDNKDYYIQGHRDYFTFVNERGDNNTDLVTRYWVDKGAFQASQELVITDNAFSTIHPGDFYILSMEGGRPERPYRWQSDGATWITDPAIQAASDDETKVMTVGATVGIAKNSSTFLAYRFNGVNWIEKSCSWNRTYSNFSVSNDYFVLRNHDYNGYLRSYVFDPDNNAWTTNPTTADYHGDPAKPLAIWGDVFNYQNGLGGSKVYRSNPSSSTYWDSINTGASATDDLWYITDDFYTIGNNPGVVAKLVLYNNKQKNYISPIILHSSADDIIGYYNTVSLYDNYYNETFLYRIIDQKYTGNTLKDYPVQYIRISPDGDNNYETTWQFSYSYGRYDPTGTTAQYNKVTMLFPDGNGKTETYFFNGLRSSEVGSTFPTDNYYSNMNSCYAMLSGYPYRTKTYDASNVLLNETINYYYFDWRDASRLIYTIKLYAKEEISYRGGTSKKITQRHLYDYFNVPNPIYSYTQEDDKIEKYTYYSYKALDQDAIGFAMKNANMLTQVSESYTKIDNLYYSDSWTVYEQKTVNGKTTYLPTKSRSWVAANPSATKPTYNLSYPGADVSYDAAGNVFETYNTKANGYSCNIFLSNSLPVASFSNAPLLTSSKYNVIADEFGDGSITDNYPLSWSTASGWSVVNGELKADNSGANALKAVPAVNMTNFNAEFDLKIYDDAGNGANYGGLEFRKTSQSHTFENSGYIVYLKANGLIGLYKNGTTIQEVQTGITSKKAHIKITGQGSSIKVFADGKQFITATDASFNGNYLGFRINGAKCRFDNLVVYPLDASYTLQSYDPSTFDVLYKIDANGQKVSYEYDSLGRLIKVRGPNGEILKEVNYRLSSEQ